MDERSSEQVAIRYAVRTKRSRIEGAGVFAARPIPKRSKIGEVTGVLIPIGEARRRARTGCRICLIDVSSRLALDCTRGNALRYLNHSCGANAYLRIFRRRVEVYARRGIKRGEEITVDYGVSPHTGGMQCRCGHPSCRSSV